MDDGDEKQEPLIKERMADIISPIGSLEPIERKAWLLNPTLGSTLSPSRRKTISHSGREVPDVQLKGWCNPQKDWRRWVGKLRPLYSDLWKKAGIFDAIHASTYRIRKDPSSIWGLVSFWCEQTNTFHFPWSEATITLEDVMIIGGLPALGEPIRVREPLPGELAEIELKMVAECRRFNQTPSKKAGHSAWMKHFSIEGEGVQELEHIAFLSLWLSRYVLPGYPGDTIGRYVFQIAIRLAGGAMIALAPAVLAAIYRDLRAVKDQLIGNGEPLVVWAPFNVLQLWVWERFIALRPRERPNFVGNDEPRAARWHDVCKKTELSYVRSVLESSDEFNWRPYGTNLDDWRRPAFYSDRDDGDCIICEVPGSFARCLSACELVGLDCIEQYLPHRVAMQFGFDQDIPGFVPRANSTWEVAWETYDISRSRKNVMLYIPPQLFEPRVTVQYYIWWSQCILVGTDAIKRMMEGKNKRKKTSFPSKLKKRKFEDVKPPKPSSNGAEIRKDRNCATEQRKSTEKIEQCSDQGKVGERTQLGEASVSAYGPELLKGTEGELSRRKSEFKSEETEERTRSIGKESELDMQIRKLKKEIDVNQVRLKALESQNEIRKLKKEITLIQARVKALESQNEIRELKKAIVVIQARLKALESKDEVH